MKLVKKLVLAGLLVSVITVNAFAGDQETPAAKPTHVTTTTTEEGTTTPISDPYTGEITAETTDYLFFEALAALLSVY